METCNGVVAEWAIKRSERTCVRLWIWIRYRFGSQGIPFEPSSETIEKLFDVFGVDKLKDIVDKPCRVEYEEKLDGNHVMRIVHFMENNVYIEVENE